MSDPTIQIHDTLSGEIRPLERREPGRVGIYACGPTTYGRIHVGNARPYVVFMLLKRFLEFRGDEVTLVINVTDINDKIYDAAREAGVGSVEHAERMTAAYIADTEALELGRPDHEPLASETVEEIVALIADLVGSGHAYEASGDVYFAVGKFEGYGKLSNRETEAMDQGEEAGTASLKRSPLDFALWKTAKEGEDTTWDSPWGPGRPGWHIECSAMAEKLLGTDFEIHGGGSDLVFPHHENEIAQTEAARGEPLARIWMHNGMIRIADQKMSKSVGNIFQLSEAIDRYGPQTLIAYLISGHYRQPLEFSDQALEEAAARVERIRNFARERLGAGPGGDDPFVLESRTDFIAALAEDFNTPRASAVLFELISEANRRDLPGVGEAVSEMLYLLGLEALLEPAEEQADAAAEALLAEREQARADRDFDRADAIRDQLAEQGWEVRDGPDGARLVPRS